MDGDLIKVIVFSLVLAALIYPGFEKLYLYRQTVKLEDLVMAPLAFIGENQVILSNDDKFTRYGTKYKSLDLLRGQDLSVGIKSEFKFHSRWVNLTEEKTRIFNERLNALGKTFKNVLTGSYSIIVFGPFVEELDLARVLLISRNVFAQSANKKGLSNLDNYCEITLPTSEHKCRACGFKIRGLFKEEGACEKLIPRIIDYYGKNFFKICASDKTFAEIQVKYAMISNGFLISDDCKDGGQILGRFVDNKFRLNDLLIILYLSILITAVHFKTRKRTKIFIFVMLIGLSIPLIRLDSNYIANLYAKETWYEAPFNLDSINYLAEQGKDYHVSDGAKVKKLNARFIDLNRYGVKPGMVNFSKI